MKTTTFSRPSSSVGQCDLPENELSRLRSVFGLFGEVPLPPVSSYALRIYQHYLAAHLSFPFPALYADSKPPIRNLVHCIDVLGLQDVAERPSQGIVCNVEGAGPVKELPLTEIGVRDDDPNYRLVDDYAYWFSHLARVAEALTPWTAGFFQGVNSLLAAHWQLHLSSIKCAAGSLAYGAFPELAERAKQEAEQFSQLPPPKDPAEMAQLIAQWSIMQGSWNGELLSRTALRTNAQILSGTQQLIDHLLHPLATS